jgi:hypothetical protein
MLKQKSRTCMQNNQTFAFARGYFWGIRPIIRKPHIIRAVIMLNPWFIHVRDIVSCFPKRFDLSSYTSVHRIMNGKRPCNSNRPTERVNMLDDFDHCVIKRTIHGLYSRKIAPTVSIIHKEIKDSIKISKSKLFGDKSDCLPILQNITIIYERNACQVRLKYTWLRERFYR